MKKTDHFNHYVLKCKYCDVIFESCETECKHMPKEQKFLICDKCQSIYDEIESILENASDLYFSHNREELAEQLTDLIFKKLKEENK